MADKNLEQRVENFLDVVSAERNFRENPHDSNLRKQLATYLQSNLEAYPELQNVDLSQTPPQGIDRVVKDANRYEKSALQEYARENIDEIVGKIDPKYLAGFAAEIMPAEADGELLALRDAYRKAKDALGNPDAMTGVVSEILKDDPFSKTFSYLASIDENFLRNIYNGVITNRIKELTNKMKGKEKEYITKNIKSLANKDPESVAPLYEQLALAAYNPEVYAQLYGEPAQGVIAFAKTAEAIERAEQARKEAMQEAQKKAQKKGA